MGLIKSAIKGVSVSSRSNNFIGAPSFRYKNPAILDCYETDKYASIYPSIKSISNEFMKIRPYAINAQGEPLKSNPPAVINALYHPNQLDSSVAFFEKLAVMNLTHRQTYLLVWRRDGNEAKPGGDINANNIAGFTFLENPAIDIVDKKAIYRIGAQEFTEKEVIVIPGGVDPSGLYLGYAPGISSARWASLDEYIADFQKGFFENGAVPAGQFVITAASKQDFDDTVDKLQEAHRGAGKNNNVTYTPRPIDPNDGKPAQAKIEWIPFQQSNKEIDFASIFEQANNRIDSTFGVPASIRGVGEANNYATARVDQQNFIRFTIEPLALRIYTQITHELNRITGGLSCAITFALDYPAVADEEKAQAETKNVEVTALRQLLDAGFTLESSIDALQLSNSYKTLEEGSDNKTKIDNDKPDVDEGDEVDDSPNPAEIDGVTPIPRVQNKLTKSDAEMYEHKLSLVIKDHMSKDIETAIDNLDSASSQSEEDDEFTDDMMEVIVAVLLAAGIIQYDDGKALLVDVGIGIDELTSYTVSKAQKEAYRDYLVNVAKSYRSDTAESIRGVLTKSNAEGWTKNETEAALRGIMNTDDWRVTRLAVSEVNRSQDMGSIYSMRQIQDETEVKLERSLLHTGSDQPCEYCRAYIDNWMPLEDTMISKDEVITGAEGGLLTYTWDNNEGHDVHANGHCVPQYRVAK